MLTPRALRSGRRAPRLAHRIPDSGHSCLTLPACTRRLSSDSRPRCCSASRGDRRATAGGAGRSRSTRPTRPGRRRPSRSPIVGPIHYVGTKDLAAYLITTPAGHILIDGAVPSMAGEIEKSIAHARLQARRHQDPADDAGALRSRRHAGALQDAVEGQRPHHAGRRHAGRRRRQVRLPVRRRAPTRISRR